MFSKTHILAAMCAATLSAPAWAQPIQAQLDGQPLTFDQPPQIIAGHVMVPIRGLIERMGGDVSYHQATHSIVAHRELKNVELTVGSHQALVEDRSVYLDPAPFIVGGRTLVPLAFVSEGLGTDVRWNASTRTIRLTLAGADQDAPEAAAIQPAAPQDLTKLTRTTTRTHNGPLVLYSVYHTGGTPEGDKFLVHMHGEPECRATFDVLGVATDVPMVEIIPGHYVGHLWMPMATDPGSSELVGRLRRDDREVSLVSTRPVAACTKPRGFSTGMSFYVNPSPGSVVGFARPLVNASFDAPIQSLTQRMLLDGKDVTSGTKLLDNTLTYHPLWDLAPGTHTVQVQAVDIYGAPLSREWSFQTSDASATTGQR